MAKQAVRVFICVRHLIPQGLPGRCPYCGLELVECRPGEEGDPCRRPVVDGAGRVRTRAPLWWLEQTVEDLWPFLEPK